jgi:uncharacterized cupin superfamily protein
MEVDGVPHRVGPGDAIAFVADCGHAYRNRGETPVRFAMAVVHPARAEPDHAAPPTA